MDERKNEIVMAVEEMAENGISKKRVTVFFGGLEI